eukprot:1176820-Prorocentrum_minimum.AAC.1
MASLQQRTFAMVVGLGVGVCVHTEEPSLTGRRPSRLSFTSRYAQRFSVLCVLRTLQREIWRATAMLVDAMPGAPPPSAKLPVRSLNSRTLKSTGCPKLNDHGVMLFAAVAGLVKRVIGFLTEQRTE